jgi:hypothetical protein
MKVLGTRGEWITAVDSYLFNLANQKHWPPLHRTVRLFLKRLNSGLYVREALARDMIRVVCRSCGRLSVLILHGFLDDGRIGFICLDCGVDQYLTRDQDLRLARGSHRDDHFRDMLRGALSEKGIDWQTGRIKG